MYKFNNREIDIEAGTVYINRPDLVLRVANSIPEEITLHFAQGINQSGCPNLKDEVLKRPNVKFYEKVQQGCATDWNFLTKQCQSKYFLLISSDVLLTKELLHKAFEVVLDNPDVKVYAFQKKNMKAWIYEVSFFWEMGGFDEQFWIGGEDDDFVWRMMEKGHNLGAFRCGVEHMEGGKHTRHMVRPENHVKSSQILWRKWGWKSKDEYAKHIKPLEATHMRHFPIG